MNAKNMMKQPDHAQYVTSKNNINYTNDTIFLP